MFYWKYLMACKFIWVESCFGWKIILLIGKWATCHWLLKCDLKTNTYGIGSYIHSLLQISEFSKYLWGIYEFSWFYSIYFWILVETSHMSLLMVFMQYLRFLDFLYEQVSTRIQKINRVESWKLINGSKIRQKFIKKKQEEHERTICHMC